MFRFLKRHIQKPETNVANNLSITKRARAEALLRAIQHTDRKNVIDAFDLISLDEDRKNRIYAQLSLLDEEK